MTRDGWKRWRGRKPERPQELPAPEPAGSEAPPAALRIEALEERITVGLLLPP